MTTDTKAVARYMHGGSFGKYPEGEFVRFADHEQAVAELDSRLCVEIGRNNLADAEITRLRSALAAKSAEVEGYRMALEVIAIGSSHNAMSDALEALVSSGFWSASMENSNEHQDQ